MNGHNPEHDEHGHEHEHGTVQPPPPKKLLDNPTVTIHFDGLIYTAYDEHFQLYQAAVHTQAEEHEVVLRVFEKSSLNQIFPKPEEQWNRSHEEVKKNAPFWLYVDSGNGLHPKEFSAKLHLPADEADERSFKRILNFQKEYQDRKITLETDKYAEFNFPQGTSYSALSDKVEKDIIDDNGQPIDEKKIEMSTLGAIDIDLVSDDKVKREIVLVNKDGKKFFNFPLDPGKQYRIEIFNQPTKEHTAHTNPAKHFLQFFELFPLNPGEKKFVVKAAAAAQGTAGQPGSPPCIQGSGDTKGGLP